MHPVRTVKYVATPRPMKQLSRAVYTVTNPLGALENKVIGAMLPGGHHRTSRGASVRDLAGGGVEPLFDVDVERLGEKLGRR